jgi:phosphocarrier protein FPr
MALEFLPEEQRAKVRLCEAPLVEGAIAAVVQAANGADIEQVLAEARVALAAKAAQLSGVGTLPISTYTVLSKNN